MKGRDQSEFDKQLRLRDRALDKLRQGVCVFDGQRRLLFSNRRYAEMYALRPEDVRPGMTLAEVADLRYAAGTGPDMPKEEYLSWRDQIQVADRVTESVVTLRNGDVHEIHHEPTADGGWVATFDDITARRRAEQRVQHMAHHDALTGLANRVLFADRLQQAVGRLGRSMDLVAVLCLDLDRFKEVNDTLGHAAGDALLRQVSERIRAEVRQADTLARLGGDEFAVILQIQNPPEAAAFAERVILALTTPFELSGPGGAHTVTIGASIGIALQAGGLDGDADRDFAPEPDDLLRCADIALYRAKMEGRNGFRFFQAGMDTRLQRRRAMEDDLRRAITDRRLLLQYQPQFDLRTRRMTGVEALVRWWHPELGILAPDEFLPLAEDIGLIGPVGEWVLQTACMQAARWPGLRLAVNLSPAQLRAPGLPAFVGGVLRSTGLPPALLDLEVSESALVHDSARTLDALESLRALGTRIVLDDFGTGYSCLANLRHFPFSTLKVDRGFVATVTADTGAAAIVRAVARLGHDLGLRVAAEGIETENQLACVVALGCDEGQGFWLGRPAEAEAVWALDKVRL